MIMAVVKAVHGHEGEVTGLVQRTQFQAVQDDTAGDDWSGRDATLILGLEGLVVAQVELDGEGARMVHVVTDDEAAAGCPSCGVLSTSVKGHAVTRPRDVPYGQARLHLVWHKRRWRCREQACPRGSFTESLPAVPARARVTTRLRAECGAGIAERFSCVLAGAVHYRISWPVATAPTWRTSRRPWRRRCRGCACSGSMRPAAARSRGPGPGHREVAGRS